MASPAKFRIDVAMHDLLMHTSKPPLLPKSKGLALPEPQFPQYPELLADTAELLASMPGIVQDPGGELHFTEWNCRAGQNNVIIRTDGTVAPCFPMCPSTFDWGNIDEPKFDQQQLSAMKKTCQPHCFSTLNHNLAYCYNDARVMKWLWANMVKNRLRGGAARSFED
jgi:radical SAM protein with 4Fe4S-binding SPASM domain